ncbi:MAG: hypothetical protein K9L89_05705 [Kiritimatiellales bacterium]|nr:hypothetical protein [Kiritimatiellales bacterium]
MKKMRMIGLSLLAAGFVSSSYASVTNNLLADAGFEAITGSEPNTNSTPWFSTGEDANASLGTSTTLAHSGAQSARFNYYFDACAAIQDTGVQIEAGKDYTYSMWMLIDEPSVNAAHTNVSSVSCSLYTSASTNGPWAYKSGFFGNVPTTTNEWQQFTGTWAASTLTSLVGNYIQIRFAKQNVNSTYKIAIDDVVFGESVFVRGARPENLLIAWDSGTGTNYAFNAPDVGGNLYHANTAGAKTDGNSSDGTFGSALTGANDILPWAIAMNVSSNKDLLGLRILNNTTSNLVLEALHVDFARINASSPQDFMLRYGYGNLSGITNQESITTITGLPTSGKFSDYTDVELALTNLVDNVLAPGESATFQLVAQNGVGLNNTYVDNIAYSGYMTEVPVVGYDAWAGGWGFDIGAATNDYDGDGLSNIYEYGLGGNPTNGLDQGTAPTFGTVNVGGTNYFGYIYPQLSDPDSGLTYSLALTTDLVYPTWATNSGYIVTGTNFVGPLDFVTNVTDTVSSQKFIKLIIE